MDFTDVQTPTLSIESKFSEDSPETNNNGFVEDIDYTTIRSPEYNTNFILDDLDLVDDNLALQNLNSLESKQSIEPPVDDIHASIINKIKEPLQNMRIQDLRKKLKQLGIKAGLIPKEASVKLFLNSIASGEVSKTEEEWVQFVTTDIIPPIKKPKKNFVKSEDKPSLEFQPTATQSTVSEQTPQKVPLSDFELTLSVRHSYCQVTLQKFLHKMSLSDLQAKNRILGLDVFGDKPQLIELIISFAKETGNDAEHWIQFLQPEKSSAPMQEPSSPPPIPRVKRRKKKPTHLDSLLEPLPSEPPTTQPGQLPEEIIQIVLHVLESYSVFQIRTKLKEFHLPSSGLKHNMVHTIVNEMKKNAHNEDVYKPPDDVPYFVKQCDVEAILSHPPVHAHSSTANEPTNSPHVYTPSYDADTLNKFLSHFWVCCFCHVPDVALKGGRPSLEQGNQQGRPRGRPPKKIVLYPTLPEPSQEDDTELPEGDDKRPQRKRKKSQKLEEAEQEKKEGVKKRGRKLHEGALDEDNLSDSYSKLHSKSRLSLEDSDMPSEPLIKRKPGRPRRNPLSINYDEDLDKTTQSKSQLDKVMYGPEEEKPQELLDAEQAIEDAIRALPEDERRRFATFMVNTLKNSIQLKPLWVQGTSTCTLMITSAASRMGNPKRRRTKKMKEVPAMPHPVPIPPEALPIPRELLELPQLTPLHLNVEESLDNNNLHPPETVPGADLPTTDRPPV